MIIISSVAFDDSTSEVLDWLHDRFGKRAFRINLDDLRQHSLNNIITIEVVKSDQVNSIWHRKVGGAYHEERIENLNNNLFLHAEQEMLSLASGLLEPEDCLVLGSSWRSDLNKINFLRKFQKIGLKIPPTIVTTKKHELLNFISKHGEVIVKPISDGQLFQIDSKFYRIYCEKVNPHLDKLGETFFPTLFQKYIPKQFEIRALYLDGGLYCMAIFSQADTKTSVDFRKYNLNHPNRKNTFILPLKIQKKIKQLMNELKLNFGVIDIIKSISGEYVFLEINPYGQFGDLSKSCNYFIEKKIAEFLSL